MATKTAKRPARKVTAKRTPPPIQKSLDQKENEAEFADYVTLEKKHDLADFADTESMRYALGAIKYDAESHSFIASDARMLAMVPASGKRLEKDMLVPARLFRKCRAFASAVFQTRLMRKGEKQVTVLCGDGVSVDAHELEGRFPKHGELVPKQPPVFSIHFKPKLIEKIAKHAHAAFNGDCSLHMNFYGPDMQAVLYAVDGDEVKATYIVMPLAPGSSSV